MRAVVQRVSQCKVTADSKTTGQIGPGLAVLLGISTADTEKEADYLADKAANLRIFADDDGKMNLSVKDIKGEVLVVSQFTLYGDCRKGRRPSYNDAASPDLAERLYANTLEHVNNALRLAKQGDREGAYACAEYAEQAIRLARNHLSEDEYEDFRSNVEKRFHSLTQTEVED